MEREIIFELQGFFESKFEILFFFSCKTRLNLSVKKEKSLEEIMIKMTMIYQKFVEFKLNPFP